MTDEVVDPADTGAAADALADQGLDSAVATDQPVEGDTGPVDPPAEPEAVEEAEPQPEPTVVGHGVVQDNVSEPGMQHTKTPEGEVTSSAQTVADPVVEDDPAPDAA